MKTAEQKPTPGPFTGRHLAAIVITFFAVVIGVNVTMAMLASRSWTGLVVANSYVASQEFNGKVAAARAQAARGWTARIAIRGGTIHVDLADRAGKPVALAQVAVTLRSPATDRTDTTLTLMRAGTGYEAGVAIHDGIWIAEVDARLDATDEPWRETRRLLVEHGDTL